MKVVSRSLHLISNCIVSVDVHQPEQNPLILNMLHDDCFRDIFKYLDLFTLTNVAGVCVRFKRIAKEIFSSNHKHVRLSSIAVYERRMLRNFGSSMESLCVVAHTSSSNSAMFQLIRQHCSSKLKKLHLIRFPFGTDWMKLHPMPAQLENLTLENCEINGNFDRLMETCTELKVVNFTTCHSWYGDYLNQKFPKIEHATFSSFGFGYCGFDAFIKLNPSLKRLSFRLCKMLLFDVINSVIQTLPLLTELEIDGTQLHGTELEKIIPDLSQLNCLKTLKLNFDSLSVTPLMKGLVENQAPIEHLKILSGIFDTEAIVAVSQMKQITILNLIKCNGLTDEHLTQLTKGLPQLKELHLNHRYASISARGLKEMLVHANRLSLLELNSIDFYIGDYQNMLATVQSRPERLKLLIEIITDWKNIYHPEETAFIFKNRNYLEITYIEPKHRTEVSDQFFIQNESVSDQFLGKMIHRYCKRLQ